jgi:hypothetical protein
VSEESIHSSSPPTIDASLGAGMVGGLKAYYAVLLALVLIVDGAAYAAQADRKSDHGHGSHNEHHGHHQAPPLLEMLPPIGPIGIVAIGVVSDLYGFIFFGKKKEPMGNRPNTDMITPEPDGWANRSQDTNGS